uniref:Protein kinase domain-containing protein n=1 Tax=Panagrolaimus sp. PS1159 TaxID=55785 RepID=A0AC35F388_9BILA
MQYWNGNECKDCSDGCEKCIGSNAGDCEICISDLCKYGDRGCIACELYKKKIHKSSGISSPINQVNVTTAIPQNTFSLNFPIKGLNEGRLLLDHKEIIGNGRFGTVYKCPYVDDGQLIWVAIKMTNYTNLEPAKEIETLLRLSHLNIVQLKAVNQKDNLILVMPLRQGDLKTFLIKEKGKITNYHQIRYCMQISDACRYMVHERIVHCDLKATNILVVNINHIEISDFGKSERLHQGRGKRVLGTVTHVAMELLKDPGSYTREATDVWSFGVTMWEIFTFGTKIPYYEELSKTKITEFEILSHLSNGLRLRPPEMLQANLHRIMITCWIEKHCERPTFNQLFHK